MANLTDGSGTLLRALVSNVRNDLFTKQKDTISNYRGMWDAYMQNGVTKTFTGNGMELTGKIARYGNTTVQNYLGDDQLNIDHTDTGELVKFYRTNIGANITYTNDTIEHNMASKTRRYNFLRDEGMVLKASILNHIEEQLSGSSDEFRDFNGIQALIPENGMGIVGEVDASRYETWRNKFDTTSTFGTTANPDRARFNKALGDIIRDTTYAGMDPSLLICSTEAWGVMKSTTENGLRWVDKDAGSNTQLTTSNFMYEDKKVAYETNLTGVVIYGFSPGDIELRMFKQKKPRVQATIDHLDRDSQTVRYKVSGQHCVWNKRNCFVLKFA